MKKIGLIKLLDYFLAPGGLYPNLKPDASGFGHSGGYGPPPNAYGGPASYNPPMPYGNQPGYAEPEEEEAFGGCLDKVGLAVGGLIAAGGVAAAMHAYNVRLLKLLSIAFSLPID